MGVAQRSEFSVLLAGSRRPGETSIVF